MLDKNSGVTLPTLAKTESDCSSASKSGLLGKFSFGQMQMPFWNAAVQLDPGELSDIVDTASGLHLILRMGLLSKVSFTKTPFFGLQYVTETYSLPSQKEDGPKAEPVEPGP